MGQALHTMWLQPTDAQPAGAHPASGCGECLASATGPRCRSAVSGTACTHPRLAGCEQQLAKVLAELNRFVVDPSGQRGIVDLQWVKALRIDDDEAELVLSFAPNCGPAQELSDSAFQTLRRLLPDTDVYVRHET